MILGAVHRSPGLTKLGDRLMKGLCDQSSPQMRSVGSHSTPGREMERKKESSGGHWVISAQNRDYWRALLNAALNLRVP